MGLLSAGNYHMEIPGNMPAIPVKTAASLLTLLECRYNVNEILCYGAHDGREAG